MKQLTIFLLLFVTIQAISQPRILYLKNIAFDTRSATTRSADFLFDKYGKLEISTEDTASLIIGKYEEGTKVAALTSSSEFEKITPENLITWVLANFENKLIVTQGTRYGVVTTLKYHEPGEYTINAWEVNYLLYAGSWSIPTKESTGCKCAFSNKKDNYLEFYFNGTGIKVISEKVKTHGISYIYLDGEVVDTVDLYSENSINPFTIYEVSGLESRQHTIKVVVSGEKDPSATNSYFVLHRFEVTDQVTIPDPIFVQDTIPYYDTVYVEIPVIVEAQDSLISNHNEYHTAFRAATGIPVIRKGSYQVWQRKDGTRYILQPKMDIEK